MVAQWFQTLKSKAKESAGAVALCAALAVGMLGSSEYAQAQTWLPAPLESACLGPSSRFQPNPPQSDLHFTFSAFTSAGVVIEYYIEIVGSEFRFYVRSRDRSFPQGNGPCYRIPVAAGTVGPGTYTYVAYEYGERGSPGQYAETPLITNVGTFTVSSSPMATPINKPIALVGLLVVIGFLARKHIKSATLVLLCALSTPPLWRVHIIG